MAYTVHQAKTHFSRLLKEAEAGQEVVVMRGKKPVAKIVPIQPAPPKRRVPGGFEGLVNADESAFNPLTDEELVEYGFGLMLDSELVEKRAQQSGPVRKQSE